MEAPVQRIIIFLVTGRTHGKDAHSRLFAIVGDILHDGETWATVSAVNERIAETAIQGIEEFVQAVFAGCGIW